MTGVGEKRMQEQELQRVVKKVEQDSRRYRPLRNLFLVDVMRDHDSRPVLYWALGTLLLGTLVYHWLEGWSYLDALYFCVVSLATVGYGDVTPTTPISRAFTIFYLINGIGILLAVFDRIRIVRTRALDEISSDERQG